MVDGTRCPAVAEVARMARQMSGRSILGMAQIRFQMNQNSKAKLRAEQIIRVTLRICMQFTLHWVSGFQIGICSPNVKEAGFLACRLEA